MPAQVKCVVASVVLVGRVPCGMLAVCLSSVLPPGGAAVCGPCVSGAMAEAAAASGCIASGPIPVYGGPASKACVVPGGPGCPAPVSLCARDVACAVVVGNPSSSCARARALASSVVAFGPAGRVVVFLRFLAFARGSLAGVVVAEGVRLRLGFLCRGGGGNEVVEFERHGARRARVCGGVAVVVSCGTPGAGFVGGRRRSWVASVASAASWASPVVASVIVVVVVCRFWAAALPSSSSSSSKR